MKENTWDFPYQLFKTIKTSKYVFFYWYIDLFFNTINTKIAALFLTHCIIEKLLNSADGANRSVKNENKAALLSSFLKFISISK